MITKSKSLALTLLAVLYRRVLLRGMRTEYPQEWTLYEDGKAQPGHAFKMERVKK